MVETKFYPTKFAMMDAIGNAILVLDFTLNPAYHSLLTDSCIINLYQNLDFKFDQIMVISPPKTKNTDFYITIFNQDGSPAKACGNGMRAVSQYIHYFNQLDNIICETAAGKLQCSYKDEKNITISMGYPKFDIASLDLDVSQLKSSNLTQPIKFVLDDDLPIADLISIGNPHAIFWFASQGLSLELLKQKGSNLEHHPIFKNRCNISFAAITGENQIKLYTWERGAGITKACGSASCATHVSAYKRGLVGSESTITLLGGQLKLQWQEDSSILMQGSSKIIEYGELDLQNGAKLAIHSMVES